MPQQQIVLKGQALAGSYYPGQRPGLSHTQRPGQHALVGSDPAAPVRDPRKCSKEREVDGRHQFCNSWAVKGSDPPLCVGHTRENEKALKNNGDDASANEGLHPGSPGP